MPARKCKETRVRSLCRALRLREVRHGLPPNVDEEGAGAGVHMKNYSVVVSSFFPPAKGIFSPGVGIVSEKDNVF